MLRSSSFYNLSRAKPAVRTSHTSRCCCFDAFWLLCACVGCPMESMDGDDRTVYARVDVVIILIVPHTHPPQPQAAIIGTSRWVRAAEV
jgi:hypothetical protein